MSNGSPWESPNAAADHATAVARTLWAATGYHEREAANLALGQLFVDLTADPLLAVQTLTELAQRVTLLILEEINRGNPAPMSTLTDGSLGKDPFAEAFVRANAHVAMSIAKGDLAGVEAGMSQLSEASPRARNSHK